MTLELVRGGAVDSIEVGGPSSTGRRRSREVPQDLGHIFVTVFRKSVM
jgi:hypothetical protein